jgi:hypothetical protein
MTPTVIHEVAVMWCDWITAVFSGLAWLGFCLGGLSRSSPGFKLRLPGLSFGFDWHDKWHSAIPKRRAGFCGLTCQTCGGAGSRLGERNPRVGDSGRRVAVDSRDGVATSGRPGDEVRDADYHVNVFQSM